MANRITLLDNEYACLWYYPDEGIVHHKFLKPIADEAFREVLLTGLKLLIENKATKWLSDDRDNAHLNAEDSAWSQDNWFERAKKSDWKYWAILLPNKTRGVVNMKRLTEYVRVNSEIKVATFSNTETALQWLSQQGTEDTKTENSNQ
jgi:hypothetical protein